MPALNYIFKKTNLGRLVNTNDKEIKTMESEKAEYLEALIEEFAAHYGITTDEAERYLSKYKAIELFDRQYGYLHTQSFESNVRDITAFCRRMGGAL